MAGMTFTMHTVSDGDIAVTVDMSNADAIRMITAYATSYGPWLDENGNPRVPTTEEVFKKWVKGVTSGSAAHVMSVEKQTAAKQAEEAVTSISMTQLE